MLELPLCDYVFLLRDTKLPYYKFHVIVMLKKNGRCLFKKLCVGLRSCGIAVKDNLWFMQQDLKMLINIEKHSLIMLLLLLFLVCLCETVEFKLAETVAIDEILYHKH